MPSILSRISLIFHDFLTFWTPPKVEKIEKTRKNPLYESAHFPVFFQKNVEKLGPPDFPSCPKYGGPAGYRQSLSKSGKISNEKIHLLKAPQTTCGNMVNKVLAGDCFFTVLGQLSTPIDHFFNEISMKSVL